MKLALAAALLLASTTAHAVSYTKLPGAPDPGPAAGETVILDFESAVAGITITGDHSIQTGLLSSFAAPPAGDATNYLAVPGTTGSLPGTATIDFSGFLASKNPIKTLSFYWGSVDSYNTLDILGAGGSVLRTIVGNDINNPANGDQSNAASNERVFFSFGADEGFTGLRLTSSSRAFEIDDVAASFVPEPQSWLMLITGFGLIGATARRRRLNAVSTNA